MSRPLLFTPLNIRDLKLENRIVIAPMCQYSADDGCMNDWHLMHLGALAQSGAGLLTIEATAVVPEGRISYRDVGLYDDHTEHAMETVLASVRRWSSIPIGIQLAHAGRKASSQLPWLGGGQLRSADNRSWTAEAPSAVAMRVGDNLPKALDREDLRRVREAFASSARRAVRLGIDVVQIHAAHGYLLHQFLSPISNKREDEYGGSLENRMRFPLEVFDAVREAAPDTVISVRISGSDWVEGGFELHESIEFARRLQSAGCDALHVSSGGLDPAQKIRTGPNYQVPFARQIKAAVGIPVVAVGLITDAVQAEAVLTTGDADFVAIARAALYDPRWPWHAAAALGADVSASKQYLRCQPSQYASLFRS